MSGARTESDIGVATATLYYRVISFLMGQAPFDNQAGFKILCFTRAWPCVFLWNLWVYLLVQTQVH